MLEIFLHFDLYLAQFVQNHGMAIYFVLFLIIFCETGLVITPFLPGDSLLFAAGSVFASTHFSVVTLFLTLVLAAFLGDNSNYWIGRKLGRRWAMKHFTENARFLKKDYLKRTELFYEKYGLQAIVIARFLPILRTLSPFVAGLAQMRYFIFLGLSLLAAILWIGLLTFAGYEFGNIPFVKAHFSWAILGIIVLSLLPVIRSVLMRKTHEPDISR